MMRLRFRGFLFLAPAFWLGLAAGLTLVRATGDGPKSVPLDPGSLPPQVGAPTGLGQPAPVEDEVETRRAILNTIPEDKKVAVTRDIVAVVVPGYLPEETFDPTKAQVLVHHIPSGAVIAIDLGGNVTNAGSASGLTDAQVEDVFTPVVGDKRLMASFTSIITRGLTAQTPAEWEKEVTW